MQLTVWLVVSAMFAAGSDRAQLTAFRDCEEPSVTPFTNPNKSVKGWLPAYHYAIEDSKEWQNRPPHMQHFELLRTMPDRPEITFQAWNAETEQYEERSIKDPVLVVTWTTAGWDSPVAPYKDARQLQEFRAYDYYVDRPDNTTHTHDPYIDSQGNRVKGSTMWFAKHVNTLMRIDEIGLDRSCFNLMINEDACEDAILWGLPGVGVPYEFTYNKDDIGNPYAQGGSNPDKGYWWQAYCTVAVADRSAFVRPSYNPTVIPADEYPATRDGVPIWDPKMGRYRRARYFSEPYQWEAQNEAIDDFGAWHGNRHGKYTTQFFGPSEEAGESGWLAQWRYDSWNPPDNPHDPGQNHIDPIKQYLPQQEFPFTCMGLTINWLAFVAHPMPEERRELGLSEFILKAKEGKNPVYIIGTWSGAQYYSEPLPWQVSWCDSCPGDLDMNGKINVHDVLILLERWGEPFACVNNLSGMPVSDSMGCDELTWLLDRFGECQGWPDDIPRPHGCNND